MDRWSLPFILIRFVGLFTLFRWSQKKTIFVVVIFFLFSLLRVAVFCYLIFWRGTWQNIIHLLQHQPKHTQKGSAKNYRTNNEERAHRLAISLLLVAISYVKRDNTYIYRYRYVPGEKRYSSEPKHMFYSDRLLAFCIQESRYDLKLGTFFPTEGFLLIMYGT